MYIWRTACVCLSLGLRMYGKDFDTIAEVIGTKTEKHVRDFFVTYQRRFSLDDILDEFYKEQRMAAVREESQVTAA